MDATKDGDDSGATQAAGRVRSTELRRHAVPLDANTPGYRALSLSTTKWRRASERAVHRRRDRDGRRKSSPPQKWSCDWAHEKWLSRDSVEAYQVAAEDDSGVAPWCGRPIWAQDELLGHRLLNEGRWATGSWVSSAAVDSDACWGRCQAPAAGGGFRTDSVVAPSGGQDQNTRCVRIFLWELRDWLVGMDMSFFFVCVWR
jgi:hypothetical protein